MPGYFNYDSLSIMAGAEPSEYGKGSVRELMERHVCSRFLRKQELIRSCKIPFIPNGTLFQAGDLVIIGRSGGGLGRVLAVSGSGGVSDSGGVVAVYSHNPITGEMHALIYEASQLRFVCEYTRARDYLTEAHCNLLGFGRD